MTTHHHILRPLTITGVLLLASPALGQDLPIPYTEEDRFAFDFPVACTVGKDCIVQNYVDVDPSRRFRDYNCKGLTYDGHRGTDIRIPSLSDMRKGIDVLAVADGRVTAIRADQEDGAYRNGANVSDKPCGNAIIVQHENGYVTQYCHLKKDSLRVVRRQQVAAGQKIAEVGMSGEATFPHLHFEVRKNENAVDPYTGLRASEGCDVVREPLWKIVALPQTEYVRANVLNSGITTETPTAAGIEEGLYAGKVPAPESTRINIYVRTVGLRNGDIEEITLLGPDGTALAQKQARYDGSTQNDNLFILGAPIPGETWQVGAYEAIYTMVRYGTPLVDERIRVNIPFDYTSPTNNAVMSEDQDDPDPTDSTDGFYIPPPPTFDKTLPSSNREQ